MSLRRLISSSPARVAASNAYACRGDAVPLGRQSGSRPSASTARSGLCARADTGRAADLGGDGRGPAAVQRGRASNALRGEAVPFGRKSGPSIDRIAGETADETDFMFGPSFAALKFRVATGFSLRASGGLTPTRVGQIRNKLTLARIISSLEFGQNVGPGPLRCSRRAACVKTIKKISMPHDLTFTTFIGKVVPNGPKEPAGGAEAPPARKILN